MQRGKADRLDSTGLRKLASCLIRLMKSLDMSLECTQTGSDSFVLSPQFLNFNPYPCNQNQK